MGVRASLGQPIFPKPRPQPAPLTFKLARKAVGGPASLLLFASLLGVRDVDGLARGHICARRAGGEAHPAREAAQPPRSTTRDVPSPSYLKIKLGI